MKLSIASILAASFFVSVAATGCMAGPVDAAALNEATPYDDEISSSSDALHVSQDGYVRNCGGGQCCFSQGGTIYMGTEQYVDGSGSLGNQVGGQSGWHCVSGLVVGPSVPPPPVAAPVARTR